MLSAREWPHRQNRARDREGQFQFLGCGSSPQTDQEAVFSPFSVSGAQRQRSRALGSHHEQRAGNRLGVGEEDGGAETSEVATAQSRLEAGGRTWVACSWLWILTPQLGQTSCGRFLLACPEPRPCLNKHSGPVLPASALGKARPGAAEAASGSGNNGINVCELMGCGPAHPGQLSMRRPLQSHRSAWCCPTSPVALSLWKRKPQAGEAPDLGSPCLDPASAHPRPHRRPPVLRSPSS
ncbi:hypothetical protein CapIbe_019022 [Capra ibex]